MNKKSGTVLRHASPEDLKAIASLEAMCFPKEEAATEESFIGRLRVYPECFWLLEEDGCLVSMVNGMVSDSPVLCDDMYGDSSLHDSAGAWQMIFGVETRPDCRRKGYAGRLLRAVISDSERQHRKGVVLTCKKELIHYYEKFGFRNEGLSESTHGGEIWYQMKLTFDVQPEG